MKSRSPFKSTRRGLAVIGCILSFITAISTGMCAQQAQNPGAPTSASSAPAQTMPEPTPQGPAKEVRFPVAHQHAFGWCYGYLIVTQEKVRYEVVQPQSSSNHSFEASRTEVTVRRWTMTPDVVELKVNRANYHMRWLQDEGEVKTGGASRMAPPMSLDPGSLIATIQNPAAVLAQRSQPGVSGAQNSAGSTAGIAQHGVVPSDPPADLPPGRMAGVYVATAGADARPSNSQYVFYADGFVVNSVPQGDMFGFDFNRFNPATNRDHYRVGHYKREGEIVKILWMDQFADPINPDQIKINDTMAHPAVDLGWQIFIPMCRCTGKRLSGTYRWGAPAADQYVQFFPDGTFIDHRAMDQLIVPSRFYEHPRILNGTYAIQNQTLMMNFSDGHRGTVTFIAPKAQENNPTFDWIEFGWHMLFEEGYRARISQF